MRRPTHLPRRQVRMLSSSSSRHLTEDREIDFSILRAASTDVGNGIQLGTLVVYETTVSIGGTRRELVPVLEKRRGLAAPDGISRSYCPDRVKANLVLSRLESTPKVAWMRLLAKKSRSSASIWAHGLDHVGSLEAAESTKLLGMLYRDVNIAWPTSWQRLRIGRSGLRWSRIPQPTGAAKPIYSYPSHRRRGRCTPVYPYFLTRESRRLGFTQRISEAAREINDSRPARQLGQVETLGFALRSTGTYSGPGIQTRRQGPTCLAVRAADDLRSVKITSIRNRLISTTL